MVRGLEGDRLERDRQVVELRDPHLELLVDEPLVESHRDRRGRRETLRHLHGLVEHRLGGHHVVHQPEAVGLLRGDEVTGHQEFLGAVGAHQQRPQHRAAVAGDDAALHVRIRDASGLGHVHDVAEQRDGGADADRVAVDGRDHRDAHREDVAGHADRLDQQPGVAVGVTRLGVAVHVVEVGADAEVLALTGEHHGVGLVVVHDVLVERVQLEVHLRVERVALLGTVEGDDEHVVDHLRLDRLEAVAVRHGAWVLLVRVGVVQGGRGSGSGERGAAERRGDGVQLLDEAP